MNVFRSILTFGALTLALLVASHDARADNGFRDLSRHRGAWSFRPSAHAVHEDDFYRYPRRGSWGRHTTSAYSTPRAGFENQIRSGVLSGRLSRAEVMELRDKQRDLADRRREYWGDDGRLDRSERDRLRDAYSDFRGDLNHELRDGERRNYRR